MYLLSVITAVFLPLGFITGLLGVNVAGIPGDKTPWAFFLPCVGIAAILGLRRWYLRRKRWF